MIKQAAIPFGLLPPVGLLIFPFLSFREGWATRLAVLWAPSQRGEEILAYLAQGSTI